MTNAFSKQIRLINLSVENYRYKTKLRKIDFDPKFYRAYYPDTAIFNSEQGLIRHYARHGRQEGRFPNAATLIEALEAEHGPLPEDFVPAQYKVRHGDLADMHESWALAEHYLRFGRKEQREYKVDLSNLEQEYKSFLHSRDFEFFYGNTSQAPPTFADLLRVLGAGAPNWIAKFNLYEFSVLNEAWLPHKPFSRMDGLYLFLTRGFEFLAPIALGEEFEPAFYRQQLVAPPHAGTDAELYRDWLSHGIELGLKSNEGKALFDLLGDAQFPACFDEAAYRQAAARTARPPLPGRFNALRHYIDVGFPTQNIQVLDGERAHLLFERIAEFHLGRGNAATALKAFDRAIALNPGTSRLHHRRGDCLAMLGRRQEATADFVTACRLPGSMLWSHIHAAHGLSQEAGRFEDAIECLEASAAEWHQSPAWRAMAHGLIDDLFRRTGEEAFSLRRAGKRRAADRVMKGVLDRIADLIRLCDPLPMTLLRRSVGHVVLIANQDLPQCTYYRVQQKEMQLLAGGWTVEIIDQWKISTALPAIDKASAVIFYRVAASPSVVHAILYARALGAVTVYDIDDLIFDAEFYPEPLASYEGQIKQEEYLGLQSGVPLFRYAIEQCDVGMASTSALADRLRPLVRSRQCHVVRNGFDTRNEQFLAYPRHPFSNSAVTVFYGSGTKAHSQDFTEIVAPALLDLFAHDATIRLALAGYVPLDPRFDRYRDRIFRVGFNADVTSYWECLSGADINIAVLSRNAATDAKSEIKWLEAAMFAIPSVVSPTATYRDVLVDGVDGVFAESTEDWARALKALASDAALRHRIGDRARSKARSTYGLASAVDILKRMIPPAPTHPPLRISAGPSVRLTTPAPRTPLPREISVARSRPARKRRILIVNVYFPPHTIGGATRVVRDNVDFYLDHASDEFDLAVLASDDKSEATYQTRVDAYRGIPVFRIGTPAEANMDWRPFNDAIAPAVETLMKQFDPDLVHFHCIQRLTATAVEVVADLGVPYIVTCHDGWWISDFQFLLDEDGRVHHPSPDPLVDRHDRSFGAMESVARRRRLGRLLDGAERVLCVSDSFTRIYREAGVRTAQSVPNGMPSLKNVIARRPSPSGRVRLGHIGGRATHKGATLIETTLRTNAFAHLELTLVDHSRTAGDTYTEIWGATPVTIIGFMPQDQIADLYAGLDVLLAPSIWPESFGLVTREAIACGLWVVASDRGAIGEDVVEGVNGFVVDVGSRDGLTRVFSDMNEHPDRYLAVPPAGVSGKRSVSDQCRDLMAIYHALLPVDAPSEPERVSD